jgi:hypothetical protein
MNPHIQQILVAAIILGALLFFALKILRRRKRGSGCGDCGCGTAGNKPKPPAPRH